MLGWWRRRDAGTPAPAERAAAHEWRYLPPLQRLTQPISTTVATDAFVQRLRTWHDPSFLAPLGHRVDPSGPSGVVTGLATVAPSRSPALPALPTPVVRYGAIDAVPTPAAPPGEQGTEPTAVQRAIASGSTPSSTSPMSPATLSAPPTLTSVQPIKQPPPVEQPPPVSPHMSPPPVEQPPLAAELPAPLDKQQTPSPSVPSPVVEQPSPSPPTVSRLASTPPIEQPPPVSTPVSAPAAKDPPPTPRPKATPPVGRQHPSPAPAVQRQPSLPAPAPPVSAPPVSAPTVQRRHPSPMPAVQRQPSSPAPAPPVSAPTVQRHHHSPMPSPLVSASRADHPVPHVQPHEEIAAADEAVQRLADPSPDQPPPADNSPAEPTPTHGQVPLLPGQPLHGINPSPPTVDATPAVHGAVGGAGQPRRPGLGAPLPGVQRASAPPTPAPALTPVAGREPVAQPQVAPTAGTQGPRDPAAFHVMRQAGAEEPAGANLTEVKQLPGAVGSSEHEIASPGSPPAPPVLAPLLGHQTPLVIDATQLSPAVPPASGDRPTVQAQWSATPARPARPAIQPIAPVPRLAPVAPPSSVQRSVAGPPIASVAARQLPATPIPDRLAVHPGEAAIAAGVGKWDHDGSVVFNVVQRQQPDAATEPAAEPPPGEPTPTPAPPAAATAAGPAATTAGAAATGAAAAPGAVPLDELARRLFDPLAARLKAELRLDRERAGLLTDLRR